MDVYRNLIIPADQAPLARLIAATLDPVNCQDMFTTGLSPTGDEPATHYISSGGISEGFAALVPFSVWAQEGDPPEWVEVSHDPGKPVKTFELCIQAGLEVTLEAIEVMYASADVTAENPWAAMARMGLQLVKPPVPEPKSFLQQTSDALSEQSAIVAPKPYRPG
jgi:hypothetical protein